MCGGGWCRTFHKPQQRGPDMLKQSRYERKHSKRTGPRSGTWIQLDVCHCALFEWFLHSCHVYTMEFLFWIQLTPLYSNISQIWFCRSFQHLLCGYDPANIWPGLAFISKESKGSGFLWNRVDLVWAVGDNSFLEVTNYGPLELWRSELCMLEGVLWNQFYFWCTGEICSHFELL